MRFALIDAERSRASSRRRSVRQCRRSRFSVAIPNSQAFSLPRAESNVGYDSIVARERLGQQVLGELAPVTRRAKYAVGSPHGRRTSIAPNPRRPWPWVESPAFSAARARQVLARNGLGVAEVLGPRMESLGRPGTQSETHRGADARTPTTSVERSRRLIARRSTRNW